MRDRKKLLNNRSLGIISLFLAAGILCGFSVLQARWDILAVTLVCSLAVFVFFIVWNSKNVFNIIASGVCIVLGFVMFFVGYTKYNNSQYFYSDVTISGKVGDGLEKFATTANIVIDDIVIDDGVVKQSLNGCATIYCDIDKTQIESLSIGDTITLSADIDGLNLFKDQFNSYYYKKNIIWRVCNVKSIAILANGKPTIKEGIREYIMRTLDDNLTVNNSALAKGLILGDTTDMRTYSVEMYRRVGLSHIFSVSGLHIGFIVIIFSRLLELIKIRRFPQMAIIMIPVIFYGYICGFPPAVVRSIIMSGAVLLAKSLSARIDLMSCMNIAMALILAFRPLYLFDAGFLMSFGAVFGIATVTRMLVCILERRDKPLLTKALSGACVSVGATIGTLPFVAFFYGEVSIVGILTNIVAIPIITFAFILLLVGLIPFLSFIFIVPDTMLTIVNSVCEKVNLSSTITVQMQSMGIGLLFLFVAMFFFGSYVNISYKSQRIVSLILVAVSIVISAISILPKQMENQLYYFENYNNNCVVVTDDGGNISIIDDFDDVASVGYIEQIALKYKTKRVDLHIPFYYKTTIDTLKAMLQNSKFEVGNIYIYDQSTNVMVDSIIAGFNIQVIHAPHGKVVDTRLAACSVYSGAKLVGMRFVVGDMPCAISLCYDEQSNRDLANSVFDCHFILTNQYSLIFRQALGDDAIIVCRGRAQQSEIYCTNNIGNFTLLVRDDKIVIKL